MSARKKRIIISIGFLVVLYGILILVFIVLPEAKEERSVVKAVITETKEQERIPETETQVAAEEIVEPQEPPEVSLVMVGDMLMHTRVLESGKKEDGTYQYDHLFAQVKDDITEADLALVNQETILGGSDLGLSSYPTFNSPYEVGDAEVDAGFDVILQATNHALDKGKTGLLNDIAFWDSNYPDIAYLGIQDTKEEQDDQIYVYEKEGIRIAILNYTYGTNGIPLPEDMPYAVNLLDEQKIRKDMEKANAISDFQIVCPHWGTEYYLDVDESQKKWTKLFLESGVDLVIGAHPHVIEPIRMETDEAGNQMLVYYSVGNFVNGTESYDGTPGDRMLGGMAKVTIGYDENGELGIKSYGVTPLVCHMAKGEAYTVYRLSDYTKELARENLILNQDSSFSLERCQELVDQVWGSEVIIP